jgi:ribosome maturation factor RimP
MLHQPDVIARVRDLAGRVSASHGLEVFEVQFRREGRGMVLRVQIDHPGPSSTATDSVSVEDCAAISRELSAILDVEDCVPGAYTLEISSPGLDRPLRQPDDYRRFVGRRAKLVVRERIDGSSFFKGRLGGLEKGDVLIDGDDGQRHRVPLNAISRAHLEVEF